MALAPWYDRGMACSICGQEGHNRSTCSRNPQLIAAREASYAAAVAQRQRQTDEDAQRSRRRWTLRLVGAVLIGMLVLFFVLRTPTKADKIQIEHPPTSTSATVRAPAPAPRPTVRPRPATAPTATATSAYDRRGLIDGGIPGAPADWKPVPVGTNSGQ